MWVVLWLLVVCNVTVYADDSSWYAFDDTKQLSTTTKDSYVPIPTVEVVFSTTHHSPTSLQERGAYYGARTTLSDMRHRSSWRSTQSAIVAQPDLSTRRETELAQYFIEHEYNEAQILDNPKLYFNPAFVKLAKQLPRYEEFIHRFYHKYRKYSFWDAIEDRLSGDYQSGMEKLFTTLQVEFEQKRHAQRQHAQYCTRLEHVARDTTMRAAVPHQHLSARMTAIAQLKTTDTHNQTRQCVLDNTTHAFATTHGIAPSTLTTYTGNIYHQQLHTEFVTQLQEISSLTTKHQIPHQHWVTQALCDGIALGIRANGEYNAELATMLADAGWKALEIVQGIGDGLLLAATDTVHMTLHPIDTVCSTVHGIYNLATLAMRVCDLTTNTALRWTTDIAYGDYLKVHEEMHAMADHVIELSTHLAQQLAAMSARDVAKHATAMTAHMILVPQVFSWAHKLCVRAAPAIKTMAQHAHAHATRIAQAVAAELPAVQTAEGIVMKMVPELDQMAAATAKGVEKFISYENQSFFKSVCDEYRAAVAAELPELYKLIDKQLEWVLDATEKMGNKVKKYITIDLAHILGMDPVEFARRGIPKVGGFHHDFLKYLESRGICEIRNKVQNSLGFYSGDLYCYGYKVKKTSFFPAHWTREQVVHCLKDAYINFVKNGAVFEFDKSGTCIAKGFVEGNITIKMCFTKKGIMTSAYPLLK